MPRSPTVRFTTLGSMLILLGACGSRTPLDAEPIEDPGPDVVDSGVDVATDAPTDVDRRCVIGSRTIGETPIDLFFALDRSRSMSTIDRGSTVSRWQAISSAMGAFIASPQSAGLGAGITFFPRTTPSGGAFCSPGDYVFPVVPIGTLPAVAPSMLKAISVQTLASSTPTTPALEGSHLYARSHQIMRGSTAAVVLVTDGAPRDCGSSVATTSAVAATAAAGSPPIRTYVLGVGPNLTNLNSIARAGGTEQAYLVESSGEANLLAALESIRTSALRCEYVLPKGTTERPPERDVRVTTTVAADGVTTVVDHVPGASACAGGPGWFYDVDEPSVVPTRVVLCPISCNPLTKGMGNRLDVAIGCGS